MKQIVDLEQANDGVGRERHLIRGAGKEVPATEQETLPLRRF